MLLTEVLPRLLASYDISRESYGDAYFLHLNASGIICNDDGDPITIDRGDSAATDWYVIYEDKPEETTLADLLPAFKEEDPTPEETLKTALLERMQDLLDGSHLSIDAQLELFHLAFPNGVQ